MSRSSADGRARPSAAPGERGQVEPLAALAAILAVTAGFGLYTGALHAAVPTPAEPGLAPTALDAVAGAASDPTGVVDPERLSPALAAGPDRKLVNATLDAGRRRWTVGPPVPDDARDRARRRVAVDTGPNRTAVGTLRVVVW
ncbi:DUF7285 family protein [Haloglomus litoreum]|uniref:DUF7285 family protein n=1 Tax=Haloglomus litoreum TaxID=3034026 RepID=UPI0023E79D91|nr:hypothetical protein [Haloglomus sp. DT116]